MEELEVILERCARVCNTTVDRIKSVPRKRCTVEAKQLYVYCALHACVRVKKKKRIAEVLGVGQWQVTYYRKMSEFGIEHERWFKNLVAAYYELEKQDRLKNR